MSHNGTRCKFGHEDWEILIVLEKCMMRSNIDIPCATSCHAHILLNLENDVQYANMYQRLPCAEGNI